MYYLKKIEDKVLLHEVRNDCISITFEAKYGTRPKADNSYSEGQILFTHILSHSLLGEFYFLCNNILKDWHKYEVQHRFGELHSRVKMKNSPKKTL